MSDWNSRSSNNLPSRRPCIRGPHCQRPCCSSMGSYGLKNKKRGGRRGPDRNSGRDSSTGSDAGGSGDGSHRVSYLDNEENDEVDGCVNPRFILEKSSSFSTSPMRGKSLTPRREYDSDESTPERAILSHSMPEFSPAKSVNSIGQQCTFRPASGGKQIKQTELNWAASYQKRGNSPPKTNLVIAITVILVTVLALFTHRSLNSEEKRFTEEDFKKELNDICDQHNIKFDPMLKIRKGIETTFNRRDTSSMVFLYQSMDETEVKEFVNKVANVSAKFLRNDTGTAEPIIVERSDLNVTTVGELVDKYRTDLEKQGVVLFQDLEDVPVNLAMAFHYYCDEYDPLAAKTAVFFTLNIAKCREYVGKTQHEMVERCLTEKWRSLEQEKLVPLLTRVVGVVIDLEEGRKR